MSRPMRLGRAPWWQLMVGLLALAAGALWWARHSPSALPAAGALKGGNVLLITVDTLRADRLGAYGARHSTPAMDALAASGAVFSRAYTHAVMTLPAHASLLTGLVPPRHGVRTNGVSRLPRAIDTVPERFRSMGYRTGAFVGAFVLDRRYGLDQGFDTYDDQLAERGARDFGVAERPAAAVLAAALAWLRAPAAGPWFAWVHLFDPHTPHTAPPRTGDPYTDEVLALDGELGRFLGALRSEGRLAHTLVILTADHGESLGEHGEATHGLFAYEATLRVPLVIAGPGISPARVDAPVSHVDVAATMLSLAGANANGLDGAPLPRAGDAPPGQRAIYFEAMDANVTRGWAPLSGVIREQWKYMDLPIPELYDLSSDPGELHNLAAREPDRSARLARATAAWRRGRNAEPERAAIDREAADRLRALGYAAAAPAPARDTFTDADDPKTLLPLHERFMDALQRAERGDEAGALAELRAVIGARPDFASAYTAAATLLIKRGEAIDAVRLLEQARASGVRSAALEERRGAALLAAGEPRRALAVLRPVLDAEPDHADAWNALAVAYLQTGQTGEARQALTRALTAAPSAAGIWTNLGLLELGAGRYREGADAFRRATELDPASADAWRGLGAAALHEKDTSAAIAAWMRALDSEPGDHATLFNLAVLLAEVAPDRAGPYLDRFLRLPGTTAADRAHVGALLSRLRTKKTPGAPQGPRR